MRAITSEKQDAHHRNVSAGVELDVLGQRWPPLQLLHNLQQCMSTAMSCHTRQMARTGVSSSMWKQHENV